MAASDYTIRGAGSFCSIGVLGEAVNPAATTFPLSSFRTASGDERSVGEVVLVGQEIMKTVEFGVGYVIMARGCADTVPQSHPVGTPMFFCQNAIGSDMQEYAAGQTVGVKVLPNLVSGAEVPIEASPPNLLAFNFRFGRPYPPAQVRVNGVPFFAPFILDSDNETAILSWVHRNRVTQADQLIGHLEPGVTPEAGTTYQLRFYRASTGALVHTITGITDTSIELDWTTVRNYFDVAGGGYVSARLVLTSERDGYSSLQPYVINFTFDPTGSSSDGYGLNYGMSYGG